jgi:hypothetical protein
MTLATWIFRLLTWDGILRPCILIIPLVVEWLNPNGNVNGILYVAIAITAVFIRAVVGARHIESNNCPDIIRHIQLGLLLLAILIVMILDAMVMAVPIAAFGRADIRILAIPFSVYFTWMAVAMYPGRARELPDHLTL